MSDFKGKYYWVKTEIRIEIGYKRNSGLWELCGIDTMENVNEAIIEVLGEVSEWSDNKSTDKALSLSSVSNLLLDGLWLDRWIAKLETKLKLEHRAKQAIQIEQELNILRTIKKKAVTHKSNNF